MQEDRTRVDIFLDYGAKRKETVWGPFLSLLNRSDGFIIHMTSRIIAKLACWGQDQIPKSDLNFYLQWLKDQLTVSVSNKFFSSSFNFFSEHHHLSSYSMLCVSCFKNRSNCTESSLIIPSFSLSSISLKKLQDKNTIFICAQIYIS